MTIGHQEDSKKGNRARGGRAYWNADLVKKLHVVPSG